MNFTYHIKTFKVPFNGRQGMVIKNTLKTSMMWLSQNILLYKGAIMQMIKKEKKLMSMAMHLFCNVCTMYNI